MCRWITLLASDDFALSDVVLAPSNSLVKMSVDASYHPGQSEMNNHVMNGDGFGIGWYHSNMVVCPVPTNHPNQVQYLQNINCLPRHDSNPVLAAETNGHSNKHFKPRFASMYKDVQPAWNNTNMRELCMATRSDCIIAHVRAASMGSGIAQWNCHPFKAGRLLFCHNGRVDQFFRIRRRISESLSEDAFLGVRGTTDSEMIFAMILTYLAEESGISPYTQYEPFGHKRLVAAIKHTLSQLEKFIEKADMPEGTYHTFNFSLTDGETVVVTRFCDRSPSVPPPSLYFAFGDTQELYKELTSEEQILMTHFHARGESSVGDSENETNSDSGSVGENSFDEKPILLDEHETSPGKVMSEVDPTTATFIVASNPLTKTHTWHALPKNSVMWCTRGEHPELRLLKRRKRTQSIIIY